MRKSNPDINITVDISELNLSPGQKIDFFLEPKGFLRLHLTENNKLVLLQNDIDLVVGDWKGAKDYRKKIMDIEDESEDELK